MSYAYALGERIKISELNAFGRVTGQRHMGPPAEYFIRYFMNGKPEEAWFYEDELTR